LKLALIFIGAPLALASRPLEAPWLFYAGLGLLLVALALPARRGRSTRDRLSNIWRHLPGANWLSRRGDENRERDSEFNS
jgi:hypothetical protein